MTACRIWKDKNICFKSKLGLLWTLAFSNFLHAFKSWTSTAEFQWRIHALENKMPHKYHWYLQCRPHYKWHSPGLHQTRNGPVKSPHTHRQEVEMAWTRNKSQYPFHRHATRNHLRQKKEEASRRKRWTDKSLTEWSGRSFAKIQSYGGIWLNATLRRDPTTKPGHRTNEDVEFAQRSFQSHFIFTERNKFYLIFICIILNNLTRATIHLHITYTKFTCSKLKYTNNYRS